MTAPALISTEQLIDILSALCAQPSSVGRPHELAQTAEIVQQLMTRCGLETQLLSTGDAPIVLGARAGREPFTLLLYHHYDTATSGAWNSWNHDPYVLAEREGSLYGRGVAEGKGPLAAHLSALAALLSTDAELPCNVLVVADGEGLIGSPHLPSAVAEFPDLKHVDACLGSAGVRDTEGRPYCYSGSKGQIRIRLQACGPGYPLSSGLASTVPNPLWRLLWAIGAIKGEDEDISIPGFYDAVEGPPRELNRSIRSMSLDETDRMAAWMLPQFLFGMTGSGLLRAEVSLPTCNLSNISVDPIPGGDGIPPYASAQLDFQLVPRQEPKAVGELLQEHLLSKGFNDVTCTILPGGYPPALIAPDHEFITRLCAIGSEIYRAPLSLLPLGPFALPLSLFQAGRDIPVASVGLQRADSRSTAANEHITLNDVLQHGQLLIELMWSWSERSMTIETK